MPTKDKTDAISDETTDEPEARGATSGEVVPGSDETSVQSSGADFASAPPARSHEPNRFRRFLHAFWAKKFLTIPLTILLLLAVILAIPTTRYPLLGLFLKKNFTVLVVDHTSGKPVSKAGVQLGGVSKQTDAAGKLTLGVPVGKRSLLVTKKYYKSQTSKVLVPLSQKQAPYKVSIIATGRQVPVTVSNKITGKPVAGAELAAAGTSARTDKDGKAIVVLPADKAKVAVSISAAGINTLSSTIEVTEQDVPANDFKVVSVGKLYFLSKQSGTIDVVKTNLDGSDRQMVLAGNGKESDTDTILLASRDWKYLALKSTRDGGVSAKLFLIDTSTDKLSTIDEGDASFTAVGWADHRFVYQVYRNDYENWQPKAQALKSFDAETAKLTTLDESDAEGTGPTDFAYSQFGSIYILKDLLVYAKNWSGSYYNTSRMNGKQVTLTSVKPDGTDKQDVKDFQVPTNTSYYSVQLSLYEPQGVYIQVPSQNGGSSSYYEYEDGAVTAKPDVTDQQFNSPYPTYLVSPSGSRTFWSDARDGKNTLFVGDDEAKNAKQIASLSEYTPYGWYSDDYLLVSKNSSELYIMPVAGGALTKISDYHKPDYNFRGYGGGYGGL